MLLGLLDHIPESHERIGREGGVVMETARCGVLVGHKAPFGQVTGEAAITQ